MNRRQFAASAWIALSPALPTHARAQADFPGRPLRLLAGSAPGTLVDLSARVYAERMSAFLRQPVVVENVAGASSLLAVRQILKEPADGYTLLATASTIVTVPHVNPRAGYAVKDLAGIGEMVRSPVVLVTAAASPHRSLAALLAAAKKAPGTVAYGSSGIATTNHLAAELLASSAGVKFSHVPYKGISAAVPDVVGGRLDFLMGTTASTADLIKTGVLRALAISSEVRSPLLPDVPTLAESGHPDATFQLWIGLVAAAGVPKAVRERLGEAMEAARTDAGLQKQLRGAGQEISAVRTPEQFDALLRTDEARLLKTIRNANIAAE